MVLVQKSQCFQHCFFTQYRRGKCLLRYSRTKKTPSQAIKTRSSKTRKIHIYPKGLTHGFGPKMAIFPSLFFQAIQARKMSFTISQKEKTPFYAIKTRSSKGRKIDIFQQGLTHGFGPKMAIFPSLFFQAIQAMKMSFTIFQNKKTRFQAIKTTTLKSRKIGICSNPWFSSKKGHFPNFVFQAIQARKMSFTILQNKKTPFQTIKTTTSKSRKIDIFPKGLTHGFGPKMAIFPTFFFLGNKGQENVFKNIV